MSFLVVLAIVAAILFALPFFTKRRLGVLGLSLAAGAMLSQLWGGNVTPIVASTGIILVRPPLESVVAATIILLPAVLLLVSGPTYSSFIQRVVGSLTFTLLAMALLLPSLGSALVIDGVGKPVYGFLVAQQTLIVTVCLLLSLADIGLSQMRKNHSKH